MDNLLETAVHEIVTGVLMDNEDGKTATLMLGETSPSNGKPRASGILTIRFAIPLLYESHLSMNPAYLLAERGGELFGWKVWDFIFKRYELYPRAEVTGLRSDGVQDTLFLKTLDIAAPVRVYAYASPSAEIPLVQVTALSLSSEETEPPERLLTYLPLLS